MAATPSSASCASAAISASSSSSSSLAGISSSGSSSSSSTSAPLASGASVLEEKCPSRARVLEFLQAQCPHFSELQDDIRLRWSQCHMKAQSEMLNPQLAPQRSAPTTLGTSLPKDVVSNIRKALWTQNKFLNDETALRSFAQDCARDLGLTLVTQDLSRMRKSDVQRLYPMFSGVLLLDALRMFTKRLRELLTSRLHVDLPYLLVGCCQPVEPSEPTVSASVASAAETKRGVIVDNVYNGPMAFVLFELECMRPRRKMCAKCHVGSSLRCSRCTQVSYCGVACQKAHWPEHKADCKNWAASVEHLRLAWRLFSIECYELIFKHSDHLSVAMAKRSPAEIDKMEAGYKEILADCVPKQEAGSPAPA